MMRPKRNSYRSFVSHRANIRTTGPSLELIGFSDRTVVASRQRRSSFVILLSCQKAIALSLYEFQLVPKQSLSRRKLENYKYCKQVKATDHFLSHANSLPATDS